MRSSLERLVQVRDAAPRNSHDAPNIAGDSRTASRAQLPAAKPLATRRSTPNLLLPVRIVAKPEGEMLAAKATHIDGMRVTRPSEISLRVVEEKCPIFELSGGTHFAPAAEVNS